MATARRASCARIRDAACSSWRRSTWSSAGGGGAPGTRAAARRRCAAGRGRAASGAAGVRLRRHARRRSSASPICSRAVRQRQHADVSVRHCGAPGRRRRGARRLRRCADSPLALEARERAAGLLLERITRPRRLRCSGSTRGSTPRRASTSRSPRRSLLADNGDADAALDCWMPDCETSSAAPDARVRARDDPGGGRAGERIGTGAAAPAHVRARRIRRC